MSLITGCAVLLVVTLFIWRYLKRPVYTMPGPKRLPFLGVAHKMRPMNKLHMVTNGWAQKYGPVLYAPYLVGPVVWLSDFDSIYEVTVKKGMLCGARMFGFRSIYCLGKTGILSSIYPDRTWKTLRKVSHMHLKQFGDGMSALERVIREVSGDMFNTFEQKCNQPFDPHDIIFDTALNTVTFLITGQRSRTGDSIVEKLRLYEQLRLKYATPISKFKYMMLDFFPWLRHTGYKPWQTIENFVNFEMEIWDDLKKIHNENPDTECLVRILLAHYNDPEGEYTETDVRKTVLNLLFAGLTTTANTFCAAVNILAHEPKVQEKIYDEIESVTTNGELIDLTKRSMMPYSRAVLYEVLRYFTVLPLSVVHCNMEETTIQGYNIPKNTSLRINIYGLHYDPKFWEDPDIFNPDRFLDENGDLVPADHPNRKHLMPFGAGTRVCLAESFAMARLFLWITTLVQRMKVVPSPGNTRDSLGMANSTFDGVLRPAAYEVIFQRR